MNAEKLQLAERLIKEGKLSLEEAMLLMEEDDCKRTEYVPYPVYPNWFNTPPHYDMPGYILTTNDGVLQNNLVNANSLDKNPHYAGTSYTHN